MRKLAIGIVCLAMLASYAQAAVLYWDGCKPSGGGVSQNVVQGDGKWTAWSAFPDGWSASTALSSVRNSAAPHNVTQAAYNSTSSQAGFAEIEFYLTGTGYWVVDATQTASSLGTGAKTVTHLSGATGLPGTTNAFSTGNAWNNIGTMKATATNPKIRFDENGTTTNRWYLDQIRLTSATPTAPTNTGPADTATGVGLEDDLGWSAGQYNSFFDVFFEANNPNPGLAASNLAEGTTSYDPGTLLPNTTYYWKVLAKNVDNSASGPIWSFTTLPEPATLVFLGLGGLLLSRRRRA